jgi:hypothetical protein
MRKTLLAVVTMLFAWAMPAAAQTESLAQINEHAPADVAVTFGIIKYTAFHSNWGFDGTYTTKPLSKPFTGLGFRAGVAASAGIHNFDGEKLKLFQGGLHLTSDKIGTPNFRMYANILIGPGNYFGATDMFLTFAFGANIPLENQKFLVRVEAAQTNDFYDGGREGGWRFSGGVSLPIGTK